MLQIEYCSSGVATGVLQVFVLIWRIYCVVRFYPMELNIAHLRVADFSIHILLIVSFPLG